MRHIAVLMKKKRMAQCAVTTTAALSKPYVVARGAREPVAVMVGRQDAGQCTAGVLVERQSLMAMPVRPAAPPPLFKAPPIQRYI
jgi:hypothetical protein